MFMTPDQSSILDVTDPQGVSVEMHFTFAASSLEHVSRYLIAHLDQYGKSLNADDREIVEEVVVSSMYLRRLFMSLSKRYEHDEQVPQCYDFRMDMFDVMGHLTPMLKNTAAINAISIISLNQAATGLSDLICKYHCGSPQTKRGFWSRLLRYK